MNKKQKTKCSTQHTESMNPPGIFRTPYFVFCILSSVFCIPSFIPHTSSLIPQESLIPSCDAYLD